VWTKWTSFANRVKSHWERIAFVITKMKGTGADELGKEKASTEWKIVGNADNLTAVEGVS